MINSNIGKYKITRLIGEGGMASVYEAEHEMLGTKVAVKVLNPILSENTQIRERFKNEAKVMASFNHPNITKIIDFDDQPHQLSIVMEFLEGEDLNDKIKRYGPLSQKEVKDIFVQTLSAFQYAHEKGVVHRDIKPSNIYVQPNGQVKILDFGIAKLFGQGNEMTQTGTQMGTPIYMSPEQVKADKSIDHRSDIYSLGVTMFYAINGKPPYEIDTISQYEVFKKIVEEPLPELSTETKYASMIKRACAKDREGRFQSCEEWLETFNTMTSSGVTQQESHKRVREQAPKNPEIKESEQAPMVALEPTRKRGSGIYIGVGLGVLLLVGLAFWLGPRKTNKGDVEGAATAKEEANPEVTIGQQVWMKENLNVSTFRNGDPIPEAKTDEEWKKAGENKQPAWCYYNNDSSNGNRYGKLYNWFATNDPRGLAPEGWKIPSDEDWRRLTDFLGGEEESTGKKMQSTFGWANNENGTNESGFSSFPAGNRNDIGNFRDSGVEGSWWSSTEYGKEVAFLLTIRGWFSAPDIHSQNKKSGFSVRCLRD
jgi:uncharacterized protein (TIGR02145 family)